MKLTRLIILDENEVYGYNIAKTTTLKLFATCTVSIFTRFYKVRSYANLIEVQIMPNKGKPVDVHNDVINKKTKRSLINTLAFNARCMPIIGVIPLLIPVPLYILLLIH